MSPQPVVTVLLEVFHLPNDSYFPKLSQNSKISIAFYTLTLLSLPPLLSTRTRTQDVAFAVLYMASQWTIYCGITRTQTKRYSTSLPQVKGKDWLAGTRSIALRALLLSILVKILSGPSLSLSNGVILSSMATAMNWVAIYVLVRSVCLETLLLKEMLMNRGKASPSSCHDCLNLVHVSDRICNDGSHS